MTLGVHADKNYLRYEIRNRDKLIKASMMKTSEIGLIQYIENILVIEKRITTICIAFAGQVKDGLILSSPYVVVDQKAIREYFKTKYKIHFFIENDMNCAVLAEAQAYRSSNVCALYLSNYLELGVFTSGTFIEGANSIATQLGHIPYKETPFGCSCGKSNCIGLFVSEIGLGKWKSYYDIDDSLTLKDLKNSNKSNEKKIYDEFLKGLFHAIGTTITLFNPEVLVLGGSIFMNNSDLRDIVVSRIQDYTMPSALANLKIQNTKIQNVALDGAFLLKDYDV